VLDITKKFGNAPEERAGPPLKTDTCGYFLQFGGKVVGG